MKDNLKTTRIEATPELLTEVEKLQIYGGSTDSGGDTNTLANCDGDKFCGGAYCANCVAQCACTHTKDCDYTGGGVVAPPNVP